MSYTAQGAAFGPGGSLDKIGKINTDLKVFRAKAAEQGIVTSSFGVPLAVTTPAAAKAAVSGGTSKLLIYGGAAVAGVLLLALVLKKKGRKAS
jgi:hypothetical protein